MRKCQIFIPLFAILLCYCSTNNPNDFEFGVKFNNIRQKFGSPLVKKNMVTKNCCGNWTVYEIDKLPSENKAYHASKTIRAITKGKLTEEKDIFRKSMNDTTLVQLDILTHWNWNENKIDISGTFGKVDKRILYIKANDFLKKYNQFPNYNRISLDEKQCDSILNQWTLSRFDRE